MCQVINLLRRRRAPLACYLSSDGRYVGEPMSVGWDGPARLDATLTWSVDPNAEHKRDLFREALAAWARVIDLKLKELTSGGQINLSWGHDAKCPYQLDTEHLAHAFYPPDLGFDRAGQVHMSTTAAWGLQYNPYSVLLHELGHTFGLPHTANPEALMYSWYKGHTKVALVDQLAMKELYRVRLKPSASISIS
jgi:predicted Zn-dependent protease